MNFSKNDCSVAGALGLVPSGIRVVNGHSRKRHKLKNAQQPDTLFNANYGYMEQIIATFSKSTGRQ